MKPMHCTRGRAALREAAIAASSLVLIGISNTAAGTPTSWMGSITGSWTDPAKWSSAPYYPNNGTPAGASYDVTIGTFSNVTVAFPGEVTVDRLTVSTSGGGGMRHANGVATLNTGSGVCVLGESYGFTGIYLNTDLTFRPPFSSGNVYLQSGTTMAPGKKVHLGGGGELDFGPEFSGEICFDTGSYADLDGSQNKTIGAGVTIRTNGGYGYIGYEGPTFTTTNNGLISAETPGKAILIEGAAHTFNNYGGSMSRDLGRRRSAETARLSLPAWLTGLLNRFLARWSSVRQSQFGPARRAERWVTLPPRST